MVTHRSGEIPPLALGGGEGKPCLQRTLEEPLLRCDQVHQLSVEEREPGDLGQFGQRGGAEGDDRFLQDGGHRACGMVRACGHFGDRSHGLTGARRSGRGQRGGSSPPGGRPAEHFCRIRADLQAETGPA